MAEIPIWVYDRPKWVSGITPATTCQDILGSLATAQSGSLIHPEDLKHLILTEKWRDVEKPLAKDSKILKIWSAWGDEQKFVKFIVKRISRKSHHRGKTGRLRREHYHRRGSVSSVDELHPKALVVKEDDNDIEIDKKFREKNDFTEKMKNNNDHEDDSTTIPKDQKDVIEEMMKIIEMQRAVISEELMKAKKKAAKAKTDELKAILEEMLKLSQLNDKLQFAEESVDRLEIALKQQLKKSSHPSSISNNQQQNHRHCEIGKNSSSSPSTSSPADDQHLISDHLACAKDEVSRLRSANDKAALEVKDNQKALDAMEQSKAERKQALKRLEYDVNVIEKEGRKLAKEYEKVLNINLDDILDDPKAAAPLRQHQEPEVVHQLTGNKKNVIKKETSIDVAAAPETEDYEEEIYTLLNSSSSTSSSYTSTVSCTMSKQDQENHSTTSGHSSDTNNPCVQELIAKESPIDVKNVNNVNQNNDENNSDTGLSSLHTSSDDGIYEVGTLV